MSPLPHLPGGQRSTCTLLSRANSLVFLPALYPRSALVLCLVKKCFPCRNQLRWNHPFSMNQAQSHVHRWDRNDCPKPLCHKSATTWEVTTGVLNSSWLYLFTLFLSCIHFIGALKDFWETRLYYKSPPSWGLPNSQAQDKAGSFQGLPHAEISQVPSQVQATLLVLILEKWILPRAPETVRGEVPSLISEKSKLPKIQEHQLSRKLRCFWN